MKKIRYFIPVLVSLIIILGLVSTAQAQFTPPVCALYGNVTLDGKAVADGTEITALLPDGTKAASTTTPSALGKSTYVLKITQPAGQDWEGKALEFRVGSYIASQKTAWKSGGSTKLDLTADSKVVPTPVPTAKPIPAPTPVKPAAVTKVEIYPGWSLIGVPQEIDLSKPGKDAGADAMPTLKDSGGYKAWYYWPADGNYYGSNYLYPGWGYWVESDGAQFTAAIEGGQKADVTIELYKGWNIISVPQDMAIEEFEKQIKVKSYDGYKAWYYYPPDGKYYGSNFLVAGWGYWVEFDINETTNLTILQTASVIRKNITVTLFKSDKTPGR